MPYKRLPILIIAVWVFITPLYAQGKISGLMFGDYYYVVESHYVHDTIISPDDIINYKGQNGFWIRRIYLTYDYKISDEFSTRLRFEMQSPDFTKNSSKMTPSVKDAYLKWKMKECSVILGISPTPTFSLVEDFWGYRAVEKTPLDLQKFTSSRDFGLAIKGTKNGPLGTFGYHIMLGNGEGNKSENNESKKLMGGFYLKFKHLLFQIYGDMTPISDPWKYVYQGFGGFETAKLRIGAQYAGQVNFHSLTLASIFATYNLNKKLSVLLRYDKMFFPSPSGISYIPFAQAKSNLLIGGIDLSPNKRVHFIPNVEYVFYNDTNGYRPDPDLYLKLTFYFKF